jgi:DNA-binding NtrC family response regulator
VSEFRQQTTVRSSDGVGPDQTDLRDARLRVVYAASGLPVSPAEFRLGDEEWLLGRDVAGRGISLEDAEVSRLHARVCWDPHCRAHRVGDAGSSNGTFVNGQRVQTALLEPGDVLRLGSSFLLYTLGDSMAELRQMARRAATTDANILLLGETGVGKEVLARSIHEQSGLGGEFVAINCAALPRDLIGSELFGHARGAFSGAERARAGLFVAADGGTLLLDEIGELPLEQQPVLLRAIQQRTVRPIGADREVPVRVRILAATQRDLEQRTEAGVFRADLYARLAQVVLHVPPLRERRADILPLLAEFLARADRQLDVIPDAVQSLLLWTWPQNVREIQTLATSFAALTEPGSVLDLRFLARHRPKLASEPPAPAAASPSSAPANRVARERLRSLLEQHDGNVAAVARELGKPRTHVYRWIKRLGLSAAQYRS